MCIEYYDLMALIEEYKYRILTLLKIRIGIAMVNVMSFFFFMFIAYNSIRNKSTITDIDTMFFILISICCLVLMAVEHIIRSYCFKLHKLVFVLSKDSEPYPVDGIVKKRMSITFSLFRIYLFKYSYVIFIISTMAFIELMGFR